jgi:molybdopterin molybdotransferase
VLPVAGTVAAGDPPGTKLPPGAALRIMTGAPLPAGADRVIPVELTDGGSARVTVERGVETGANVRRRGEIARAGAPLLAAGAHLTPGALALLAAHGIARAPVHRAPRVAVLTTGDEVVAPEAEPAAGQLRDSHTDFLAAAGATLGLRFELLGIARDEEDALRDAVARGLDSDLLLVCGGVSRGEFDLVGATLAGLGCTTLFHRVAIQPGQPLLAARHSRADGGGLVLGLPGNPGSVMAGFWLFARPVLRRLLGLADGFWGGSLRGELAAPLPGAGPRDRFLPAQVRFAAGRPRVTPLPPRGSHDLVTFARGNALVRIRPGSEARPVGGECEILPLADWREEGA